jgi:hypothetical protein
VQDRRFGNLWPRQRWLAGRSSVVQECAHDCLIGFAAGLFGGRDDHVQRNFPTTGCGRCTTGQPGASGGIASMQLLAATPLLARIDRAWAKGESLADARGPHGGAVDRDHQTSSSIYPGGSHLPTSARLKGSVTSAQRAERDLRLTPVWRSAEGSLHGDFRPNLLDGLLRARGAVLGAEPRIWRNGLTPSSICWTCWPFVASANCSTA